MDPEVHEIITRFKSLSTTLDRRNVCHHILNQLGPHEWRDIQRRMNERSFQKDILGELPLEIAVQITQYLGLADIHLLRRVSKRWDDVLSSDLACGVAFRQYTGHGLNTLQGESGPSFTKYSKRRLRLEQGRPVCKLQTYLPLATRADLDSLDYSNGRYAWITDMTTLIMVYNPRSQKTQRFCTENREHLGGIRLSQSIVAAYTDRGYCYAWDLETEEMHTMRLPHSNISIFSAYGYQLSLGFHSPDIGDDFVMHYDMKSRITRTIKTPGELVFVGISPSSTHLTMVVLDRNEQSPSKAAAVLRIEKHEFNNNSPDASLVLAYKLNLPPPKDQTHPQVRINYAIQRSCRNRLGLLSYPQGNSPQPPPPPPPSSATTATSSSENPQIFLPITFDPETDDICLHNLPLDPTTQLSLPLCMANIDRHLLYYVKNHHGKRSIWISNPNAETPHTPARNMDLGLPRDPANGVSVFIYNYRALMGDRDLVSMVDATGAKMWYFVGDGDLDI